jgi:hypothetical protein
MTGKFGYGWATIYFKNGKITEVLLDNFAMLDERIDKDDIKKIEIGLRPEFGRKEI